MLKYIEDLTRDDSIPATCHITLQSPHRQSWCGEKEVLVSRIEECQSQQQALSEQLNEARRNNKKVTDQAVTAVYIYIHHAKHVHAFICILTHSLTHTHNAHMHHTLHLLQLQKHYKKQVQELKLSVDVLTAKEEQLTLEKEALR